MTIQEELKEGTFKLLFPYAKPKPNDLVDAIFKFLDERNVVIKVDRELPKVFGSLEQIDRGTFSDGVRWCLKCHTLAGYVATESLIED